MRAVFAQLELRVVHPNGLEDLIDLSGRRRRMSIVLINRKKQKKRWKATSTCNESDSQFLLA